tara:strand:+ start:1949 stop:2371 length:423 start_codon:yes stop_codon:yes gene_type:complete
MMNLEGRGLAIVCKWSETQFGRDEYTSKNIEQYWFVLDVLNNEDDMTNLSETLKFYESNCETPVSLELVDYFCLPGEEMVGICKTFWLKMIQRKWKKVYAERQRIMQKRKTTKELLHRERHGKWSSDTAHLPTLRGMLAA